MKRRHTSYTQPLQRNPPPSPIGTIHPAGFTLIELLVVVGIIALLLSLLMTHLSAAKETSMSLKCRHRLKSIGIALELYAKDHEGFLPIGYIDNKEGGEDGQHVSDWGLLVQSYLFNDGATNVKEFYEKSGARFSEIFQCPSAKKKGGRLHYSANHMLMPYESELRNGVFDLIRLANVSRLSEILLVADASQTQSGNANALFDSVIDRMWTENNKPVFFDPDIDLHNQKINPGPNTDRMPDGMGHFRFRHNKNQTANILFADIHVESRRPNELRNSNILIDE